MEDEAERKTQRRKDGRWEMDRREDVRAGAEKKLWSQFSPRRSPIKFAVTILVLAAFCFWFSEMVKNMGATSRVVQSTITKGAK